MYTGYRKDSRSSKYGLSARGEKVLSSYIDAQDNLPFADDSNIPTPMSDDNGTIITPSHNHHSAGRPNKTTLGGSQPVVLTKENQLRQKSLRSLRSLTVMQAIHNN
jgi:hypothetical protein